MRSVPSSIPVKEENWIHVSRSVDTAPGCIISSVPPAEPRPAASVVLVRSAPPGAAEPLEVWMVRRQKSMKFLGGYYAFPGGRVDPADGTPEALARCHGLTPAEADQLLPEDSVPALAYWVAAARELLEESGLLIACDRAGNPIAASEAGVAAAIERVRKRLMAGEAPFAALLAAEGWYADARPLRYLSHFITPTSSPIRFSARFFLCPLPAGQVPRLYTEETSEGFWIAPGAGYHRFRAGEMAMAEPAEYGLAYLAQFESLEDLWTAHADGHDKFEGLIHKISGFWKTFDWQRNPWRDPATGTGPSGA
jgi:8-oxo-dGTP pyrophosphatase MutT (NUDIX family)